MQPGGDRAKGDRAIGADIFVMASLAPCRGCGLEGGKQASRAALILQRLPISTVEAIEHDFAVVGILHRHSAVGGAVPRSRDRSIGAVPIALEVARDLFGEPGHHAVSNIMPVISRLVSSSVSAP